MADQPLEQPGGATTELGKPIHEENLTVLRGGPNGIEDTCATDEQELYPPLSQPETRESVRNEGSAGIIQNANVKGKLSANKRLKKTGRNEKRRQKKENEARKKAGNAVEMSVVGKTRELRCE
jgi:hypothetical protein